jgi:hypothetical protein
LYSRRELKPRLKGIPRLLYKIAVARCICSAIAANENGWLWIVDAHRDEKRFIVKADDLLTAFLSLERDAIAPKGANGNATRQNVG